MRVRLYTGVQKSESSLILCDRSLYFVFTFLATDVVTVYVFHEPSLLSSLQDKDLTGVVLKSLVVKDVCILYTIT